MTGAAVAASQRNLLAGLASIYDTIEIRTAVTPPAVIDLAAAAQDQSPPSPITRFLRPTIILSGRGGTDVIAPYGEAEGGWAGPLAALGLLVGAGYVLGRFSR